MHCVSTTSGLPGMCTCIWRWGYGQSVAGDVIKVRNPSLLMAPGFGHKKIVIAGLECVFFERGREERVSTSTRPHLVAPRPGDLKPVTALIPTTVTQVPRRAMLGLFRRGVSRRARGSHSESHEDQPEGEGRGCEDCGVCAEGCNVRPGLVACPCEVCDAKVATPVEQGRDGQERKGGGSFGQPREVVAPEDALPVAGTGQGVHREDNPEDDRGMYPESQQPEAPRGRSHGCEDLGRAAYVRGGSAIGEPRSRLPRNYGLRGTYVNGPRVGVSQPTDFC